jgi:conjugal transfer/type IV secretion protein DotA/TraY
MMMRSALSITFSVIFVLVASMDHAVAQQVGFFEPAAPGDKMTEWMSYIFVGAMGDGESPAAGLGEMMAVINGGILTIATVLLTYNVIAGVAQSAHEGKILGQRWSSLWAPIRPVLGLAMLVPLPSGYCAIQALVLAIAGLGVTLANTAWETVVEGVASGTASITSPYVPGAQSTIEEIMRREVCWQALDRQLRVMQVSASARRARISATPAAMRQSANGVLWDYGHFCGSITLSLPDETAAGRTITVAIGNEISSLMSQMRPLARQLAYTAMPGTGVKTAPAAPDISAWLRTYSDTVGQAVAHARSEQDSEARRQFSDQAKQGGFVYAGSWYHTIAALNSEFLQAAQLKPEFTGPNLYLLADLNGGQEVGTAMGVFEGWWRTYVQPKSNLETDVVLATEGDSTWERLISPGKWEWIYSALDMSNGTNPLAELTGFGHKLLWTTEATLLAATTTYSVAKGAEKAAEAGSNVPIVGWFAGTVGAGAAGAITGAFEFLKEFFFFILGGMFVAGAALAYWLPMVPYILWLVSLLGYLVFLVEAVVASTLWAFAHVRMDGDGLAGEAGKTGYEMVFNLLTRPVLMVTGLVIGYLIFSVGAAFIGETFYAAMRGAMGSHIVGLIGLLVLTVMFVYLFVLVANKSFSLIHVLPDRVAIWLGAGKGAQPLGEEGDMQKVSGVAVGGVVQKAENATSTSRYQSRMLAGKHSNAGPIKKENKEKFTAKDTIP